MSKRQFRYLRKKATRPFSCYIPQCDVARKLLKRIFPNKKTFNSRDSLSIGVKCIHNYGSTTDCHLTINEIDWEDRGRPIIYVNDKYLIEMMYKSKLEIVPESLHVPFGGLVSFAFPKGTKIDGVEIDGCLFGEMDLEDYRQKCLDELKPYYGNNVHFENQDYIKGYRGKSVYLVCMAKHSYVEGMPAQLRIWFKKEDSVNIVNEGWVENNLVNEELIKDYEFKKQRVMFRLCYALCIYMSTFPDVIKDGFPEDYSQEKEYRIKCPNPKTLIIHGTLGTHASPHTHFRRWHFRSLVNEKYKRNPDGSIRTVFVKASIVNPEKID